MRQAIADGLIWTILGLGFMAAILVLPVVGWTLGVRDKRRAVKRDLSALDRWAGYEVQGERRLVREAVRTAARVINTARRFGSVPWSGQDEALVKALRWEHQDTDRDRRKREVYGLVLGVLVVKGVLGWSRKPMRSYGVSLEEAMREPELIVERLGVVDLYAWPPSEWNGRLG